MIGMKAGIDAILRRPQAEYLDTLLPDDEPILVEMEHYAAEHRHPIADPEVAQLMRVMLAARKPKRILEIGTNIGYSVVVIGRSCPDSVIETIEVDRATLDIANEFVTRADIDATVVFHHGAALEVIPRLEGKFDFVFIDCVKSEYVAYLDLLMPKIADGGVVMCDNLLWGGQVAEGPKNDSQIESTEGLKRFNEYFVRHPELEATVIAVGDGIGLATKV